ncbi:MAG: restriction endonuclease subunit S [Lachnospiraceae bacterium]|nr:restriction endonuclease subunit S [Lachnospiraceae bacterium]
MQIGKLVQEGAITIKTGPFGTQLKAAEYQETGIPVLNVKNLGYGTVNSAKLDHVGADTVERLRIHLLQQGDIVFGRKGAVDRHAYIDNESDGWMQGSDCIRLRVETDDINPRFLSYYFLTNQHKAFMISMCSHGTTMASLNQKILEQIDFPCLERNYQDKIVEILSKIDEKGRVNQKINENLTSIEQNLAA